ncbi:MAG: GNAT family N-acetyltransferase, partial [Planctomycetes bacterium]|nr:GNAT family N-acetyltransferase [Planctomycetota bacterium]
EEFCEACFADWPGGTLGYVAVFAVLPAARRRRIGSALWDAAMARVREAGVARIAVDGQCLNPYYGNSAGPRTPLYGTPEGIGIGWGDAETRRFLANRGHEPRFKGVSLEISLAGRDFGDVEETQRDLQVRGFELRSVPNAYPDPGTLLIQARTFDAPFDFETVSCTRAGIVQGYLVHYPMTEVSARRRGVFELQVLDTARGLGIGSALVRTALARMQADRLEVCEVFTIPELSPGALDLYLKTGFNVAAEWAVY